MQEKDELPIQFILYYLFMGDDKMYVLGIDGGGTKTKGVIATSTGEIVAEATVGASNPNSVTKEALISEFKRLFDLLSAEMKDDFQHIGHVYAGMSGVDHPTTRGNMEELLRNLLPDSMNVTVTNDAIIALYSGTLGKPGIVQIGGTGSITFGLNEKGDSDRVGGWGYLLGEKGSGYSIGSQALEKAFRAHDGLEEKTMLTDLILTHFDTDHLPSIIPFIYQSNNSKGVIAALSKEVISAGEQGDETAKKIIDENALYIAEAITCLIHKLFSHPFRNIPIVFTGGLFNRLDMFQDKLNDYFASHGIDTVFIKPKMEPVGGAVVAALIEEVIDIPDDFRIFKK